jgi:hypothetical protein
VWIVTFPTQQFLKANEKWDSSRGLNVGRERGIAEQRLQAVNIYSFRFIAYIVEPKTPLTTKETKNIMKSLQWKYYRVNNEILLKILKISIPFMVFSLTYMCVKLLLSCLLCL